MNINVINATTQTRLQPVIFGTKEQTEFTYKQLPGSYLNVGWVKVPPSFEGEVEVLKNEAPVYRFHPTIEKALNAKLKMFVVVDGVKTYMDLVETHVQHKDLLAVEFRARTAKGIAKLWTYVFSNYAGIPFEFGFYCESLQTPSTTVNLAFGVECAATPFYRVFGGNAASLINGPMDDCQGKVWRGVMGFYVPDLITQTDIETFIGEWEHPLMPMAEWKVWGPWEKELPPVNQAWVQAQFDSRKTINYSNTFGHYGQIGAMSAGQTGDQGGWGTWQNIHSVGSGKASLMYFDYLAAMQDNVRPIHYFEINGTRFKSSAHRDAVFWSQKVHWHRGVASDRLYRIHNGDMVGSNGPWTGYDDQHCSGTWIANAAILVGSLAAMDYCRGHIQAIKAQQTLPSTHPGYPTNGVQSGRGARMYMAAVMHYFATGDSEGIAHIARQLNETMFVNWVGYGGAAVEAFPTFSHPTWQIKPTSLKGPGPASGQLANYASWTVWEDGLWAMNADALRIALEKCGFVTEANKLKDVVYDVAKSVTMYGWHPNQIACGVAIKWNGDGTPCEDYLDPNKAKYYTAYNNWMVPCLTIALREAQARNEQDVVTRATYLRDAIVAAADQQYILQHLGAR